MKHASFFAFSAVALAFWAGGCGDDSSVDAPSGGTNQGGEGGEPASSAAGEPGLAGSAAGSSTSAGDSAGGAGGAVSEPCVLGSEWAVVDDYVHAEGIPTNVVGVAADSAGSVYAVGLSRTMGQPPVGVMRRSSDAGTTWADVTWTAELPNDIAADGAGNLFVTAGLSKATVLKSSDQGDTFDDVFEVPTLPGSVNDPCNTGFVATGPAGIIVAGASCDSSGWVLSKSEDAGETWGTLFTFQLSPGKPARMHDVGVDAFGKAYAIGNAQDADGTVHWMTVREGDQKGIVSDDFQLEAGLVAEARGFVSSGAPLVVGFGTDGEGVHGIVRRQVSVDEWQTIDQFDSRATDIEAVGAQFVVSGELENTGTVSVRTRRSDDSGGTWQPLADYGYAAGQSSFSGPLTADPTGNVYGAVAGRDADDVPHWIIRKLSCR